MALADGTEQDSLVYDLSTLAITGDVLVTIDGHDPVLLRLTVSTLLQEVLDLANATVSRAGVVSGITRWRVTELDLVEGILCAKKIRLATV